MLTWASALCAYDTPVCRFWHELISLILHGTERVGQIVEDGLMGVVEKRAKGE